MLLTGCLTKRLANWAVNNEVLCSAQKGFMPFDGAFKNNYVLEQLIQLTHANGEKELCIASIDITNAFGKTPHPCILKSVCVWHWR